MTNENAASAAPATSSSATVARWGSLLLQIAIAVFPLSASGLLAPPWALAVVAVGWLIGLVAVWQIGKSRPYVALVVPVATLGAWFAFITAGERLLGWVG